MVKRLLISLIFYGFKIAQLFQGGSEAIYGSEGNLDDLLLATLPLRFAVTKVAERKFALIWHDFKTNLSDSKFKMTESR